MAEEQFTNLPKHIAIIMDGNGRWAKKRLLPRTAGHKAGVDTLREIVEACGRIGISYLTVYAFSSENWNREQEEVSALIDLLQKSLRRYVPELKQNNVRLHLMGDLSRFPEEARRSLLESEAELASQTGLVLSVCLSYGGRQELVAAYNKLASEGKTEITAEDVSGALYSAGIPDPDLIIRTSGEYRISNFLLWQSAYAEYYFTDVLWPDFREEELKKALHDYETRSRRFGK